MLAVRHQQRRKAEVCRVNDMPKACGQTGCRRKESERRLGLASQNTRGQYGQEAQYGAVVNLTRGWGTTAQGLRAGVPWAGP
jgi:hypothetical protein